MKSSEIFLNKMKTRYQAFVKKMFLFTAISKPKNMKVICEYVVWQ